MAGANAAPRDFAGQFVQAQRKLDPLAGSHPAVALDLEFRGLLRRHGGMLHRFNRLNKEMQRELLDARGNRDSGFDPTGRE